MINVFFRGMLLPALIIATWCFPSSTQAQNRNRDNICRCCTGLIQGNEANAKGDYELAVKKWSAAQRASDSDKKCPNLSYSIKIAKAKIRPGRRAGIVVVQIFKTGVDKVLPGEQFSPKGPPKTPKGPPKRPKHDPQKRPSPPIVYQMGDHLDEGDDDEIPIHTVAISNFWISDTEVTFAEYDSFCIAKRYEKPDSNGWSRGRRPVINVDWYDAIEYCNWRSKKEKLDSFYNIVKTRLDPNNREKWIITWNKGANGYRLPTEAEWEYAARENGKTTRFGNGKDIANSSEINFDARTEYKKDYSSNGFYGKQTMQVDSLSANAVGCKHLSGNVSEWCWDWYSEEYYKHSATDNPKGPESGSNRVCRGGSWRDSPRNCRASYRKALQPIYKGNDVGFRLARSL